MSQIEFWDEGCGEFSFPVIFLTFSEIGHLLILKSDLNIQSAISSGTSHIGRECERESERERVRERECV